MSASKSLTQAGEVLGIAPRSESGLRLLSAGWPAGTYRRLLVLVPPSNFDASLLAASIAAAAPLGHSFLLLRLSLSPDTDWRGWAALAQLSSELGMRRLHGHSRLVKGRDWFEALPDELRPGDLLACQAEERYQSLPLGQALAELSGLAVCVFDQPYLKQSSFGRRLARVASLLIPLAIIAGFFWLQNLPVDGLSKPLQILLSLPFEIALLLGWSRFQDWLNQD